MRLFLAIYPPKEYLDYLRDVIRKFNKEKRNLQLVPVDQMHITMRYIGSDVSDGSKELLIDNLKKHEGNYGKAKISINSVQLGFPYQKDPKIILADIKDSNSLIHITEFSHAIIKDLRLDDTINFKVRRANSYHISLARLKKSATRKQAKFIKRILEEVQGPNLDPVVVSEMYLVESVLQKDSSSVYKKLDRIKL